MDILRLAMLLAALVACAPSLAGFGTLPQDTSAGDVAPSEAATRPDVATAPEDASDGAVAPDVATVADAATDAATDVSADAAADVSDASDASETATDATPDVRDAASDADPCGGACANRPHTTMSECHPTGACLVWCAPGFADCDQLGSNGCETDLSARESCGGCAVRCGDATFCWRGMCRR